MKFNEKTSQKTSSANKGDCHQYFDFDVLFALYGVLIYEET